MLAPHHRHCGGGHGRLDPPAVVVVALVDIRAIGGETEAPPVGLLVGGQGPVADKTGVPSVDDIAVTGREAHGVRPVGGLGFSSVGLVGGAVVHFHLVYGNGTAHRERKRVSKREQREGL